jgi:hypothetical protein
MVLTDHIQLSTEGYADILEITKKEKSRSGQYVVVL